MSSIQEKKKQRRLYLKRKGGAYLHETLTCLVFLLAIIGTQSSGLAIRLRNASLSAPVGVARKVVYRTPDKHTRAIVIYYKPILYGIGESRVDIKNTEGHLLKSRDYSDGGTEGYRVVKAAWTADSRFFVFSTTSAGGHSAWRYPTHFYDRQRNQFYSLDALESSILNPNFRLSPPSRVTVEVFSDRGHREVITDQHMTFDLSKLDRKQLEKTSKEDQEIIQLLKQDAQAGGR